jgi:hypothetical protein
LKAAWKGSSSSLVAKKKKKKKKIPQFLRIPPVHPMIVAGGARRNPQIYLQDLRIAGQHIQDNLSRTIVQKLENLTGRRKIWLTSCSSEAMKSHLSRQSSPQ